MSISSSNERIPPLPYLRIWILMLVAIVAILLVWNSFWASKGIYPTVNDSPKLWSYHRKKVKNNSKNLIVLIGSSAILTSINQEKLTQLTNKKSIQLAIGGASPIPVLSNLAEDENFNGIIISDFTEFILDIVETKGPLLKVIQSHVTDPNDWVLAYNQGLYNDDFEYTLKSLIRKIISEPSQDNLPDFFYNLAFNKLPIRDPIIFESSFNRTLHFYPGRDPLAVENLTKLELEILKTLKEKYPLSQEKFIEIINIIEDLVQKIQLRGGRVIFLSTPKSGEFGELYQLTYPKKDFWDKIASRTSARTVHFKDYEELARFVCPDGLHLDSKDSNEFTENLVKIISEKDSEFSLK